MAETMAKPAGGETAKTGHTFRDRLHAWWEGYELPDAPKATATGARTSSDAAAEPPPVPEWNSARQELVQMLRGKGFSIPGEEEYILNLVKPFGLTK